MSGPARWAGLLFIALLRAAMAGDATSDSAPDVELLEFLGMFVTDDGEWVDPTGWLGDEPPPGRALDMLETKAPQPATQGPGDDD